MLACRLGEVLAISSPPWPVSRIQSSSLILTCLIFSSPRWIQLHFFFFFLSTNAFFAHQVSSISHLYLTAAPSITYLWVKIGVLDVHISSSIYYISFFFSTITHQDDLLIFTWVLKFFFLKKKKHLKRLWLRFQNFLNYLKWCYFMFLLKKYIKKIYF